jgi:hypothetical protein
MKRAEIKEGGRYRVQDSWPAYVNVKRITTDKDNRTVVHGQVVTPATNDYGVPWARFGVELVGPWNDQDQAALEEWRSVDRMIAAICARGVNVRHDYQGSGFVIDRAGLERLYGAVVAFVSTVGGIN